MELESLEKISVRMVDERTMEPFTYSELPGPTSFEMASQEKEEELLVQLEGYNITVRLSKSNLETIKTKVNELAPNPAMIHIARASGIYKSLGEAPDEYVRKMWIGGRMKMDLLIGPTQPLGTVVTQALAQINAAPLSVYFDQHIISFVDFRGHSLYAKLAHIFPPLLNV